MIGLGKLVPERVHKKVRTYSCQPYILYSIDLD